MEAFINPFTLHIVMGSAYIVASTGPCFRTKNEPKTNRLRRIHVVELVLGACYLTMAFSSPAH